MIRDYEDLDYDDLFHLIGEYSNYVTEFFEEHTYPEQQVSIYEFYDNKYQEILRTNNEWTQSIRHE